MDAEALMQLAIGAAEQGIAAGQAPFGCAIALDGHVLAVAHNTVWQTTDITAHAEINALRGACASQNAILLAGAVVATTCEPCPMCAAALHWARVATVYYGADIADARTAGFSELQLPAADILQAGARRVQLVGGVKRDECAALFAAWQAAGGRSY